MYDAKPGVMQALSAIPSVTVSDAYPTDWAKLPHISFYEIANNPAYPVGRETKTEINIQIDIWHNRSTGALAAQVDQSMHAIGFRRAFAADVPDPAGVKHKTMRYRGIVDKNSKLVYQ